MLLCELRYLIEFDSVEIVPPTNKNLTLIQLSHKRDSVYINSMLLLKICISE